MERKEFLRMGCCAFAFLVSETTFAEQPGCDNRLNFIQNWVTDLMETID